MPCLYYICCSYILSHLPKTAKQAGWSLSRFTRKRERKRKKKLQQHTPVARPQFQQQKLWVSTVYWHLLAALVALLVSLCQSGIHSCSGSHSEPRGGYRRRQNRNTCLNWWLYQWRLWRKLRCRKEQTSGRDRDQWHRWEGGIWIGWHPQDLQGSDCTIRWHCYDIIHQRIWPMCMWSFYIFCQRKYVLYSQI